MTTSFRAKRRTDFQPVRSHFRRRFSRTDWKSVLLAAVCLAVGSVAAAQQPASQPEVSFTAERGQLHVRLAGENVASYVFEDKTITRPFFAHVRAPGGIQVTRNYPPQPDDAQDHATFHPGIWLAFGDIGGHDYWRLKAKVVHDGFVEKPHGGAGRGGFAARNRYLSTDGKRTVCREVCRVTLHARPAGHVKGYVLVWDSTFSSDDADFAFGDQEEMGLGVRLATPIAVTSKKGGRILDSAGRRDGAGIWGKAAEWCDYSGTISGQQAGVLVVPNPANFRPAWWHARDYGLLVANPFGRRALTGGKPSSVVVRRGEMLRLRFGLLIHATALARSETDARFDPAAAAGEVLALLKASADDQTLKYVRPSSKGPVDETVIRIEGDPAGRTITSVTSRGATTLTLTSRYGADERLREANVRLASKSPDRSSLAAATVAVADGKATVRRAGREPATFDCPPGVIVTSAPDWTDAVVAVRRYDPAGNAMQEFPGLWIHSTQEPARLTFRLTRQAEDEVSRAGRRLRLLRLALELRGGSKYIVWRNDAGHLVRLMPQGKPEQAIVLSAWEEVTRDLKWQP